MSDHRTLLDEQVEALCALLPAHGVAGDVGIDPSLSLIDAQLATGGKRLRGLLPVWIVESYGGDLQAAMHFGAAVEAVHNGTLIHDDIQDQDTLRRGQPTLWTEVGVPQAINAGDLMLVAPILALLQQDTEDALLNRELAILLAGALVETIRGQVADVGLRSRRNVSRQELLQVACAKTSPLFACALQGAALILGRDEEGIRAAKRCGDHIGRAFQIRDDLLDTIGTKGRGRAGADLREGKPTWPLLAACEGEQPEIIKQLWDTLTAAARGCPPTDEEISHWLRWAVQRGAVDRTQSALDEALTAAREAGYTAFPGARPVVDELCERLRRPDG